MNMVIQLAILLLLAAGAAAAAEAPPQQPRRAGVHQQQVPAAQLGGGGAHHVTLLHEAMLHPGRVRDPRTPSLLSHVRRFLQQIEEKWDPKKKNRETQATSYTSQGQDPGGPGDAFTYYFAESSASNYNGVYYNDNGKAIHSGDMAKGGWSGAYAKNSAGITTAGGTTSAVAANFQSEYSSQRGTQAISGTFCGARAVAGSSSFFNAQKKDPTVPWGGQAISTNIDSYGPTPQDRVSTKKKHPKDSVDAIDRGYNSRRSVAFTDIPPNSAAQSFTGNGPVAIATGWEVASASRAARDKKPPPVTIGSREDGQNGVFDAFEPIKGEAAGRRHRLILQCR